MLKENEIKVWVGNLGKYNEGSLVGDWFTLPMPIEDVMQRIGVAPNTQYEEFEIFDWEGNLATELVGLTPNTSINWLNEVAEVLDDMTELEVDIALTLMEAGVISDSREDLIDTLIDVKNANFYRIWENAPTLAHIAEEIALESGRIKEDDPLFSYVDFELYANNHLYLGSSCFPLKNKADTWIEVYD